MKKEKNLEQEQISEINASLNNLIHDLLEQINQGCEEDEEIKKVQEEIKKRLSFFTILCENGSEIISNLEESSEEFLNHLSQKLKLEKGLVLLDDGSSLRLLTHQGYKDEEIPLLRRILRLNRELLLRFLRKEEITFFNSIKNGRENGNGLSELFNMKIGIISSNPGKDKTLAIIIGTDSFIPSPNQETLRVMFTLPPQFKKILEDSSSSNLIQAQRRNFVTV